VLLIFRKKVLIAGPYAGEFGWELMEWQGWVRRLREKYDRTIVISYPNREYLYEGCEFYPHDIELKNSGYAYGTLTKKKSLDIVRKCVRELGIRDYDWFAPHMLRRHIKMLIGRQDHIKFYEPPVDGRTYDIVFHFRDFQRDDGDLKNYPKRDADEIAQTCKDEGYRIACIGDTSLSYCPPAAYDMRSIELKETVRTISSSKLVVGGSSAPMHLASLCGIPIVLWTGPPFDATRYFSYWNPLKSKVFLVTDKSFQPGASEVLKVIKTASDQSITH